MKTAPHSFPHRQLTANKIVATLRGTLLGALMINSVLNIATLHAQTSSSGSRAEIVAPETKQNKQASTAAPANDKEVVRQEVAKPLEVVRELMKEKKYAEALVKVREIELIPNKSPYEMFIIDQMRGAAAAGAGDNGLAVRSFEAVLATNRLKADASLPIVEAIAGTYYRSKDYKPAVVWARRFIADGGTNPLMRLMLQQSLYLSEDYVGAAKDISDDVAAQIAAGKTPSEDILKLLASCALKQKDNAAYVVALEKLVIYHPKKDYWADFIYRFESKPTFSDRLSLDVYRLKFQMDLIDDSADYMRMALLANQAGFPVETKAVLEHGYARDVLGKGADAPNQKKLLDAVKKELADDAKNSAKNETEAMAAKDGTALVGVGFNNVLAGQAEKGAQQMEQGIKKGGLKRPEEVTLRLGIAYTLAGQKDKAIDIFKTVKGADGTGDLAMLWSLYAGQVKKLEKQ